jgi:hypothetical protein
MESMNPKWESFAQPADEPSTMLVLAFLSLLVGATSRFIGASFRPALMRADRVHEALFVWAHGEQFAGFLLVTVVCALPT